jgi:Leucine-rich repeat (LRR) protein
LSLTSLVQFGLFSCKKCQHLPTLDQFSSLKSLTLDTLHSIEYIDNSEEGLSDSSFLSSLEELRIEDCPNLKGWWRGRRDSVEEIGITTSKPLNYSFPCLSRLDINYCPQLTYMPLFPYLEELTLCECSLKPLEQTMRMGMINMTASPSISSSSSILSFAPLSKLNHLSITDMDEALPEELLRNLISLRTLHLIKCPLPPQGMRYLTALQLLNVGMSEVVDPFNDWDEMEWQGLRSLLYLRFELPKLVSLPVGLQHLTSLQTLEITDCPNLMSLSEWIGGLTSLQVLYISECPELMSLPEWIGGLTSLQKLSISECPKLTSLPEWIGGLTSLQTLYISECPELTSLPEWIGGLSSLQTLYISECPKLTSLPEWIGGLTSLQTLYISECPELTLLPEWIGGLSSLQTLYISECPKLTSLPEWIGGLTSLQTLYISECPELTSLPEWIDGLSSLQTLYISECPKLTSLLEWIGGLTSLQTLYISECPELTSLPEWIGGLSSLQTLYISECPKLTSLPEWIGGLTSLQALYISECPILSERCKREIGEDWPKIAKIPNLYLFPPEEDLVIYIYIYIYYIYIYIYIYPKPNFFFLVDLSQYLLVIKFQIKRKLLLRIGT